MRGQRLGYVIIAMALAALAFVGIALAGSWAPIFTVNAPRPNPSTLAPLVPPTTTAPSLSPRPRELPLAGIHPCALLTRAQRTDLSLDQQPVEYVDAAFDHAVACSIRGASSGTVVRLALVTSMGVTVWLDSTAQVDARSTVVATFPALIVRTPGLTDACNVEVDTSANGFLDIMFRDGGNTPPIPQDVLCQGAVRVAEAAVTTLSTMR